MKVAVAVVAARKDGGCCGLSCVPHNSYVEVPTPRTAECDYMWR